VSCVAGTRPELLRLAFLGTPPAAAITLQALIGAGHEIAIVVSRADARRGRGSGPTPSPVKALALAAGIEVTADVDDVVGAGVELGVVVAFGRLIRPPILDRVPMVNLHFSLLPRWRGAAPVERAILAGDPTTGVCLMAVEEGLDTGGVYRRLETAIGERESADQLRHRLAVAGSEMLVEALATGLGPAAPQEGEVTYATKLTPADRHLEWARPARELGRVVRIGRAWTTFRGRRLLVLDAWPVAAAGLTPGVLSTIGGPVVGTGAGGLALETVQPEGRPPLAAADWVRGARPVAGERLGDVEPGPGAAGGSRSEAIR
jgi:methionyl-tRNA formyltransferase